MRFLSVQPDPSWLRWPWLTGTNHVGLLPMVSVTKKVLQCKQAETGPYHGDYQKEVDFVVYENNLE